MSTAPKSPPSQEKAARPAPARFSQARLSRLSVKRDKVSQEKARKRVEKRRRDWEAEQSRLNMPVFIRKFCELLLLSCLIGPVIAYNLQLGMTQESRAFTEWFSKMLRTGNGGEAVTTASGYSLQFLNDLFYLMEGTLPVLQLKSSVWLMLAVVLVAAFMSARLFERFFDRRVFAEDLSREGEAGRRGLLDRRRLFVLALIMGFMGWSFLSFSPWGWGPEPVENALLTPEERLGFTAGWFGSLVAWLQVLMGLMFFMVVEDMMRTRRLVYKVLGCILGLAAVSALLAVLLQGRDLYFTFVNHFWVRWGADEVRNDLGSLIGHNTAISSYLMPPFLIVWAMLMSNQGTLKLRQLIPLAGMLSLFALVLLMAQSRAAIPILVLMFVLLVILLAREAKLRPPMPYLVGLPLVLVALVLTQLVQRPENPFYRRNIDLQERVQHLTFSHLQTETRLRILVASLPAVAERPLQGWGFRSFPYVYPQVQGEYFQEVLERDGEEKEFFFAPTSKRSFHAHNEYLQTAFETGLVGLGLGLVAVLTILISGWRVMRRTLRQRHVAIQLGILTGLLALLLHALADFPFRVAPLAVLTLTLLAIWSAGDRLWLIPVPALEDRFLNDSEIDRHEKELLNRERALTMPTTRFATWGILTVALIGSAISAMAYTSQWLSSEVLANSSRMLLNEYMSRRQLGAGYQDRVMILDVGLNRLERAHKLSPLSGEPLLQAATFNYYLGRELKGQLQVAFKESDETMAKMFGGQAVNTLSNGIEQTQRSMLEDYYHSMDQSLGFLKFEMFSLNTRNAPLLFEAMEHLKDSVELNPGDPTPMLTLMQWATRFTPGDRELPAAMLRRLSIFHNESVNGSVPLFVRTLFDYVINMQEIGSFDLAYQRMSIVQELDPQNSQYTLALAQLALYSNRFEEALLLNRAVPLRDNPNARLLRGQVSLRRNQWSQAFEDLQSERVNPRNISDDFAKRLETIRPLLRILLLPEEDQRLEWYQHRNRILALPNKQELLLANARALFIDFNLPERALEYYEDLLGSGAELPPLEKAVMAQAFRARHSEAILQIRLAILNANESGVPEAQYPRLTDNLIVRDLQRANELDQEAIKEFQLHQVPNEFFYLEMNNRIEETKFVLGNFVPGAP
jgi:O-antigen ligase